MVNKCAVFGCKRGYESKEKHDDYHAFYFPTGENKSHLLTAWEKFVARKDWNHTKNSVICEFHFEEKFILKGKRWTLKWKDDPVPTIFTEGMKQAPLSVQPTAVAPPRKPPLKRNYQEDEYQNFLQQDVIHDISASSHFHLPCVLLRVFVCGKMGPVG